jgi:hypothetical protein
VQAWHLFSFKKIHANCLIHANSIKNNPSCACLPLALRCPPCGPHVSPCGPQAFPCCLPCPEHTNEALAIAHTWWGVFADPIHLCVGGLGIPPGQVKLTHPHSGLDTGLNRCTHTHQLPTIILIEEKTLCLDWFLANKIKIFQHVLKTFKMARMIGYVCLFH